MSVHQRRDTGSWFVKWRENGKQKTRSFGKDGEEEARDFDKQLKAKLTNDVYESPCLTTLADFYFQAKEGYLDEGTRKDIIRYIVKSCDHFNMKPCDQVGRRDLTQMRINLGSIKPVTKNKAQAYINAIFNWGVENEYLSKNPWSGAKRLKQKRFKMKSTIDDFRVIMAHSSPHLKWALEVSFNLALRPGKVELLSLEWSAFNWDEGCVEYEQGKGVGTKTVYPSSDFLAKAKVRYERDSQNNITWVVHKNGKSLKSIRSAWRIAKRKAGYENHPIRPYDIRHIAATQMLAKGADPAAVQHQLGHKRLSTTLDNYSHVLSGAQKRAATMLPKLEEEDE